MKYVFAIYMVSLHKFQQNNSFNVYIRMEITTLNAIKVLKWNFLVLRSEFPGVMFTCNCMNQSTVNISQHTGHQSTVVNIIIQVHRKIWNFN